MALLSTEVTNLINGVSQQAEDTRFSSQVTEQINGDSNLVEGLVKRPPLEHIAKLNTIAAGSEPDSFVHFIDRGDGEQFVMVITTDDLKIYDLEGTEITVEDSGGAPVDSADLAYVLESNPRDTLKALTVLDYTFILNRNKTTALDSAQTPARSPESLLFVKQARINTKYTIRLYSTVASSTPDYTVNYTTPNTPKSQADILAELVTALDAAGADADYFYEANGAVLYLQPTPAGPDFKVEVEAQAPEAFFAFKDSVQSFTLLPEIAHVGMKFLVKGAPDSGEDDYYVEFVKADPDLPLGFQLGFWEESTAEGIDTDLDATTMPHALTWDGTKFTYAPLTWDSRAVGDDDSNPAPSFVTKKINDIFFWRNRLGFLAGENVVLSESAEYFNFWRTSVISLLDTDLIDVSAADTSISILRHAIPAHERLIVFSDNKQFVMPVDDVLSPKTVRLPKVSDTPNLPDVLPVTIGNFIFAPFKRGGFSGIYQFSIQADTNELVPSDITSHIPQYLDGVPFRLAASPTENLLMVITDGLTAGLYVYKYFDRGQERLQSSWSKFDFGSAVEVRGVFFVNSKAYCVLGRDDGTYLESLDMEPGKTDSDSTIRVLVDRRVTEADCTLAYDADADETTITLPYTPDTGSTIQVVTRATSGATDVVLLRVKSQTGADVVVSNDHSGSTLWAGQQYEFSQELTRPQLVRRGSNGENVVTLGRFQVRDAFIVCNDSVYFTVEVTPLHNDTYTYTFNSRISGEGATLVGSPATPRDAPFRVPVKARNTEVTITIKNDSPFPCKLLKIDYTGSYHNRFPQAG